MLHKNISFQINKQFMSRIQKAKQTQVSRGEEITKIRAEIYEAECKNYKGHSNNELILLRIKKKRQTFSWIHQQRKNRVK